MQALGVTGSGAFLQNIFKAGLSADRAKMFLWWKKNYNLAKYTFAKASRINLITKAKLMFVKETSYTVTILMKL